MSIRGTVLLGLVWVAGCAVGTRFGADDQDGGPLCDAGSCGAPSDSGRDGSGDDAPIDSGRCAVRCGPLAACCANGEECVADRCLPSCENNRCGDDDSICCGAGLLCADGACITPGGPCRVDTNCRAGELCEPALGLCVPIPEDTECRYLPPRDVFAPHLEWDFSDAGGISSHPMVTQLNDDDGDGVVSARDTPDVVFHGTRAITFEAPGNLRMWAISGGGGALLWTSDPLYKVCGESAPAIADLDHDGTVEIATLVSERDLWGACGGELAGMSVFTPVHVAVFDHLGVIEWVGAEDVSGPWAGVAPSTIADLDGDGFGEVIANGYVYSHDGTLLWEAPRLRQPTAGEGIAPAIADVDGDGRLEVFGPSVGYDDDGTELWHGGAVPRGGVAIANVFPSVPGPQLIVTGPNEHIIRDPMTGAPLFGPFRHDTGDFRMPHPVVADFDGDGQSELGVSSENVFRIVDPVDFPTPPHTRWEISTSPDAGRIGATVFDFDGDGQSEIALSSYCSVRIVDGDDGSLLWSIPNDATNSSQFAVIADVDGDFHAELLTMSDYALDSGNPNCDEGASDLPYAPSAPPRLRVWGDDNWVATRPTWNQLAYHLDNVADDGALPMSAEPRWSTHNTYRINQFPDPRTATLSPNLEIVGLEAQIVRCPDHLLLRARIRNRGARGVLPGVKVAFYRDGGERTLLGLATTTELLLSGSGQWVSTTIDSPPLEANGTIPIIAIADDEGTGASAIHECTESDNASAPITVDCSGLI